MIEPFIIARNAMEVGSKFKVDEEHRTEIRELSRALTQARLNLGQARVEEARTHGDLWNRLYELYPELLDLHVQIDERNLEIKILHPQPSFMHDHAHNLN